MFLHPDPGQCSELSPGWMETASGRDRSCSESREGLSAGLFLNASNGLPQMLQIRITLVDKGSRQAVGAIDDLHLFVCKTRKPFPDVFGQTGDIGGMVWPGCDLLQIKTGG